MRKFLSFICVIACILSMTGCGETDSAKETHDQNLKKMAEDMAINNMIPFIQQCIDSEQWAYNLNVLSAEELEYLIQNISNQDEEGNEVLGIMVDGNAFKSAVESFAKSRSTVGVLQSVQSISSVIDKKSIVVTVDVTGTKDKGIVEMVFSKDMFLKLESASVSHVQSVGDMMEKAVLNTVLGMGTVFAVLVLICFIIAGFGLIGKAQDSKKKKESDNTTGINNAVAQIIVQEEEAADDMELVAVIAAAVAAYEGAASSDGYVVRSIRKINR